MVSNQNCIFSQILWTVHDSGCSELIVLIQCLFDREDSGIKGKELWHICAYNRSKGVSNKIEIVKKIWTLLILGYIQYAQTIHCTYKMVGYILCNF